MKTRGRTVIGGILNHCYQRTVDGCLLFYSTSDYLVFYTLFCTLAVNYQVNVLSLCLMPDHFHISIIVKRTEDLSGFMQTLTSCFARIRNQICHDTGQLFQKPFGSVPIRGDKKARTNLCYIGNNGVERRLCEKAEDYRWNFLAYYNNKSPFSAPLIVRNASNNMKKAVNEIRLHHKMSLPLSYYQLRRIFSNLNQKEKEQLTDFIISSYNVIDYESACRFFDNYEDMLTAMHSNTGSEHDLNEVFIGRNDLCYGKMISYIIKNIRPNDIHDILSLPAEQKYELFRRLSTHIEADPRQIANCLRMPLKRA